MNTRSRLLSNGEARSGVLVRVTMLGPSLKSKRGCVAFLAAGLLLFAQMAMAAQACMLAQPGSAPTSQQTMDGCDSMPMDTGTCLARCAASDQAGLALDQHFNFVAAPAHTTPAYSAPGCTQPALRHVGSLPAAGPPLRVLYCSYLI